MATWGSMVTGLVSVLAAIGAAATVHRRPPDDALWSCQCDAEKGDIRCGLTANLTAVFAAINATLHGDQYQLLDLTSRSEFDKNCHLSFPTSDGPTFKEVSSNFFC